MSAPESSLSTGFRLGFAAPWDGLRHMRRNRPLWRYALAPIALNLLITGLLLALLVWAAVAFGMHLHPRFAGGFWLRALEVLVAVALGAATLGATAALWILFQAVLCGFFYGRLARQVELQLGTPPEELTELPFWREAADGLRLFLSLVGIHLGLLFLHLVPVIGSVAAVAGGVYFDCWLLGKEFLQFPLALRGLGRRELQTFAEQHRRTTLGLGAATLLLSLVPVVNAVLLTTAVTGTVLLRRRLVSGLPIPRGASNGPVFAGQPTDP